MNNKNLFSIGEITKSIGITRKIILNYEVKGIIQPDKKDGATGNRYYTVDTFTQIRTIRLFQNLGLSLDEIREYFNDTTDLQPMIDRLEKKKDELILAIEKLKEKSHKTNDAIKEIIIEPQTIYHRIYSTITVADKTNLLRDTAYEAMKTYGIDSTRRMLFTEFSAQSPTEISYCIAVPPESEGEYIKHIPALKAISFFYHGAYEEIPEARKRLISYAEENNIKLSGTFRNLYFEGPPQHKDKSRFITQIIAITK